jgi:hypothetical protein
MSRFETSMALVPLKSEKLVPEWRWWPWWPWCSLTGLSRLRPWKAQPSTLCQACRMPVAGSMATEAAVWGDEPRVTGDSDWPGRGVLVV